MFNGLFEKRRGHNRSLSMLVGDLALDSPALGFTEARSVGRSTARPIPRSMSCANDWAGGFAVEAQEDVPEQPSLLDCLEISELCYSPTIPGRKVWMFSPTDSPVTSRCQTPVSSPSNPVSNPVSCPTVNTNAAWDVNDHRGRVICELIETERRYISQLEVILGLYLPSLVGVVSPKDLRVLLPDQLEPLLEAHKDLLSRLEERSMPGNAFYGIVGDLFGRLCALNSSDFINTYGAYISEFKTAMRTLARYENSQQFREAVLAVQRLPKCHGLSLASLLLTPVQRLPRYELLLKELVKQTPLDHPDSYYLEEALLRLRAEMKRLNQSIRFCQLACSIDRVGRKNHKRSKNQRSLRVAPPQMRRHISTSDITNYTGREVATPSGSVPHTPGSTLSGSLFRSSECILDDSLMEEEEEEFASLCNRTASCSDLLLEIRVGKSVPPKLGSLPSTPPPSPQPSTKSAGFISTAPASPGDSFLRVRSRSSMSSSTSSTSGFASLSHSRTDLSATPVEGEGPGQGKRKASLAFTGALNMLRNRSFSSPNPVPVPLPKPDISYPADFRHIQHGFVETLRPSSPDSL